MSPKPLIDRTSYEPAYSQLVNIIRRQIAQGEFPPGGRLPSESQLCKQHGVSPMTVRRAINLLVEQGVVDTAQGKGTFVKPLELGMFSFQLNELQDIFRDREKTRVKLLEVRIVTADQVIAQRLSVSEGDRVIYIGRLISSSDEPLLHHQQYLIYDPSLPIVESEMDVTSLGGLLSGSGETSFKKGLLSIGVTSLGAREAAYLRGEPGSPAFRLEHTFFDFNDRRVSWGWFTFRGDRFNISTRVGLW
ncbi:MAG: GntR family transcriptional regulator [Pseudomonadota bacterium]